MYNEGGNWDYAVSSFLGNVRGSSHSPPKVVIYYLGAFESGSSWLWQPSATIFMDLRLAPITFLETFYPS